MCIPVEYSCLVSAAAEHLASGGSEVSGGSGESQPSPPPWGVQRVVLGVGLGREVGRFQY